MRYSKKQLADLEDQLTALGYSIRIARGLFSSNACVIKNTKVILLNSILNPDSRYALLKEIHNTILK